MSLSSITRLESGSNANPKIRQLANCALVLVCQIEDLIEPDWRAWATLRANVAAKPTAAAIRRAQEDSFAVPKPAPPAPPKRKRTGLPGDQYGTMARSRAAREREARKRAAREQARRDDAR
jgi:hypothetical protein